MNNKLIILFLLLLILTACTRPADNGSTIDSSKISKEQTTDSQTTGTATTQTIPSQTTLKGITLTPKSFSSADFTEFLTRTKNFQIVSWAGDWNALLDSKSAPYVLMELSKSYNFIPLIEVQFFTQATGKLLRPLDEANKKSYKESIVKFASKYKPQYLALGIEVNMYSSDDFIPFYNECYTAIKEVSPDTKVFTIFQLEKLSDFSIIDKYNSDLIVFTTYPILNYKTPSEIPSDYYSKLKFNKPVAFTEIGWPSSPNTAEQSAYVLRFFDLTKSLKPEFSIWSFLYDQNTISPFNSMGLIDSNNNERDGYKLWMKN